MIARFLHATELPSLPLFNATFNKDGTFISVDIKRFSHLRTFFYLTDEIFTHNTISSSFPLLFVNFFFSQFDKDSFWNCVVTFFHMFFIPSNLLKNDWKRSDDKDINAIFICSFWNIDFLKLDTAQFQTFCAYQINPLGLTFFIHLMM